MKNYRAICVIICLAFVMSGCGINMLFEPTTQFKYELEESATTKPTDTPTKEPEDVIRSFVEVTQKPTAAPTKAPTKAPTAAPAKSTSTKKEAFMRRAQGIEEYEAELDYDYMDQNTMNTTSADVFSMWDKLLNDVYQYLKDTMPSGEFSKLRKDELNWIKKKEKAMDDAGKIAEGGSMEPLLRSSKGTEYTKQRCYYLISLID